MAAIALTASRLSFIGIASFGRQSPFLTASRATTALRSVANDSSEMKNLPQFTLEDDRYRLYAAPSCPFAHRVRLVRLLHGLEDSIKITFVTGQDTNSFLFDQEPEPEFGATTLRQVYDEATDSSYEGKATVPMLLDRTNKKMVNNESLDSAYALAAQCANDKMNLLPEGAHSLAQDINDNVSVAVYKYLFNPDAKAKQEIAEALWAEFAKYNDLLGKTDYLMGNHLSVADCVLWASVIRFDNVYARQFGLEGKTIVQDYPNLAQFAKRIWNLPTKRGDTTLGEDANLPEIIRTYWQSGNLSPKAGNDPTSPPPEAVPVF